jgi:type VI secretion system protein ImpA
MILTSRVESLLQAVASAAPCGADLEYDPAFLELERLVQGRPEQQMGSAVVPAQEPDWDSIAKHAAALLGKTKDLRVVLCLTRALLNRDGFAGLRDGLAVLRGLVERHWDGLFPRLEPAEANDPTFRINILMGLCDSAAVIERVRAIPLVTSRAFGRFNLRDLAIASGELPPARGTAAPASIAIDGAFSESAVADLQATASSVRESLEHLAVLETTVAAHVGLAHAPSFSMLSRLLEQAHKTLAARLEVRAVKCASPAAGPSATPAAVNEDREGQAALTETVTSREEVARCFERICDYYQCHEPSSPMPLLLQRCKRLVSASFLDIVRDVAPDAVSQVEMLRGRDS